MATRAFSSRFLAPLLLSGTLLPSACESPKNHLDQTHYEVYAGETFRLKGHFASVSWEIANEFVVKQQGEDEEEFIGLHVGETRVRDKYAADFGFTVEVKPRYSYYIEPFMGWDISQDSLVRLFGLPYMTDDLAGVLTYENQGDGGQVSTSYLFELQNLVGSIMVANASAERKLYDFLAERYAIEDTEEEGVKRFFRPQDETAMRPWIKIVGLIAHTDKYIYVLYAPSQYYLDKALEAIDDIDF